MALKKYTEVTLKFKVYQPTDRTPDKSIEEIQKGIASLGGKGITITGNKLTNDIPNE